MPGLAPPWLLAAVPEGLVLVGARRVVEIELSAHIEELERAAEALANGNGESALVRHCGLEPADASELAGRLAGEGAFHGDHVDPPPPAPLARTVLEAFGDDPGTRTAWTAEELLVLPAGLSGPPLRRALRAFIAGMDSHARLRAYAQLALGRRPSVWGDVPDAVARARGLERARDLDAAALQVVDLRDGSVAGVETGRLDGLGGDGAHRLGPVTSLHTTRSALGGPELHLGSSRGAKPNLRFPGSGHSRASGIGATRAQAGLVARAEAIERYAAGDVAAHELRRAAEGELDGAVSPDSLCRYNRRQYEQRFAAERYHRTRRHLWVAGETLDGRPRWIAAAGVFFPFRDPELEGGLPPPSSSGVAAHTDPAAARQAALAELIERDAFMWTWVQRIARERLDRRGLDERTAGIVTTVEGRGYTVELVNLTLDSWPVVMCAMHDESTLSISAACRRDPLEAAAKAVPEACVSALWPPDGRTRPPSIAPEAVALPEDHQALYAQGGEMLEQARFLISSPDRIGFEEVTPPQAPLEELVSTIGEPLWISLSSPATRPFHVFRALVPGMVPISFGYDREPLGMPRLAGPKTLTDGRSLGRALELERHGPMTPHPFP